MRDSLLYVVPVMNSDTDNPNISPGKVRWLRLGILLLIYSGLIALGHWGGDWLIGFLGDDPGTQARSGTNILVMMGIALYTVLMALPFIPGMEISLALFAAFGQQVAIYIYAATVLAFCVSFLIGRLVDARIVAFCLGYAGLQRAEKLVRRLEHLNRDERLDMLMENAPKRFIPFLLKHRHIAIAVAINLPGNALIGGGGGIALLAGMSGLYRFPHYLVSVSLAVAPVPLAVLLMAN